MPDEGVHRAFLALGSNICPEQNLPAAVSALRAFGRVMAVSSVWESAPVGFHDQENFLNAAVLLSTWASARMLCESVIPRIEAELKRIRDPDNRNGPRTIDIDLALYDDDILQIGHHHIPDPDIFTRPFLAIPLAELDSEYVHPKSGTTLREVAGSFPDDALHAMRRRDDVIISPLPGDHLSA